MNKLKYALTNNEITLGTWIQIPHPAIVEIIASNCSGRLDWICIDMEHGSIDIESMTRLIRTIEKFGLIPVVRIPQNDYIWIHRVLDAGAKGLIVPMVNSQEEARVAVQEAKYPPDGRRSYGYSRANNYGSDFDNYIKEANSEISVIVQIEHVEAIVHLDEILNVKGIDATFIGPLDLKGSMWGSDEPSKKQIEDKLKYYLAYSEAKKVTTGYHIVRPTKELIGETEDRGYKMIAVGLDTVFLEERVKEIF
jgi:2-dehydro-3-deoxyglucarate aldolase